MIPLNKNNNHSYTYSTIDGWLYKGIPMAGGQSKIDRTVLVNDTQAGYKVPGWKNLVKSGSQAGSPYSRAVQRVDWNMQGRIAMQYKYVDTSVIPNRVGARYDYSIGNSGISFPANHRGSNTDSDNRALQRFYMAIQSEYQKVNALISLAEGREVVSQIRRPFAAMQKQVVRHLDNLNSIFTRWRHKPPTKWNVKKRDERDRMIRDVMADSWLETSFGINPTLSDVVAIAEAFSHWKSDADTRRSTVKGFHESRFADPIGDYHNIAINLPYVRTRIVETGETSHKVIYRCGIRTSLVVGDSFRDLARVTGFQPENFIPTLYEVIPYSWLVDYFTTLGACLNANATVFRDVLWVVKSTVSKSTLRRVQTPVWGYSQSLGLEQLITYGNQLGDWQTSLTTISRSLLVPTSMPLVKPTVRSLSEINPLQVGNILALIQSKMRKVNSAVKHLRI